MNQEDIAPLETVLSCYRCRCQPVCGCIKCTDATMIFTIECTCGVEVRSRDSMDAAVKAWNRSGAQCAHRELQELSAQVE